HDYPMPHAVCPEEIADLRQWWHQQLDVLTD
ncbi:MAG: carboxylesterase, partial [Gammaproteobacteria bacterium]